MNNLKERLIVLGILLTLVINITGCKEDNKNRNKNNYDNKSYGAYYNYSNYDSKDIVSTESESEKENESLSNDGFTEKDIVNFLNKAEDLRNCPNEELDYTVLYNRILNNSKSLDPNINLFYNENLQYTEEEIVRLKTNEECLRKALDHCFQNATNNISEDICALSDIKIVNGRSQYAGIAAGEFNYRTKTITIDFEIIQMDFASATYNYSIDEYLTNILTHELNHARQYTCSHRKNQTITSIDDVGFSSIIESSAESALYNCNTDKINPNNFYCYKYSEVRYLENLLFLMVAFQENKNLDGYYNAIMDTNALNLYDFFGLKTDEDYNNFYDIIYVINTLKGETPLYKKLKNNSRSNIEKLVGENYKIKILDFTLRNLKKTIQTNVLSIEECLTIYYIIKGEIIATHYNSYKLKDYYDENIFEDFLIHEKEFFEFLEDYYQIDRDYIESLNNTQVKDNYKAIYEYVLYDKNIDISLIKKFPIIKNIIWTNPISSEKIEEINMLLNSFNDVLCR